MRIAAYVLSREGAKPAYKEESHDVRLWGGFEMVRDALRRSGHYAEYAGKDTIHKYDVILYSITSNHDWYPFLAEMALWKPGDYTVVIGGAGVHNVRPFLPYADCFVLGRGENIVVPLINALAKDERLQHESVIWSDEFSVDNEYMIAQASQPYPHEFTLADGKSKLNETVMGCPYKCFFCPPAWHRKYYGPGKYALIDCPGRPRRISENTGGTPGQGAQGVVE